MKLDYRPDIDGLRAIAVISVLLFHLNLPLRAGFLGVDVFFVISGFLITRNIISGIDAGNFTLKEFYLARLRRIGPALLATLILTFVFGAIVLAPGALQDLSGACLAAVASLSNIFFYLGSGYFDSDSHSKPLLHTWSLGVEEQFYLVWPLLLLLLMKRTGSHKGILIPATILVASSVGAQYMLKHDAAAAFFMLPFRAFELSAGAVLAFIPIRASRAPLSDAAVGLGIALIIASAFFMNEATPMPGVMSLVPCAGAALIIYFGASSHIASRLLTNFISVFVGKISYSLYLVHWPIVVFAEYLLMRSIKGWESALWGAVSLLAAYLLYVFVEQPFRRKAGGLPVIRASQLAGSMALAVVVLSLAASSAFLQSGWPWRVSGLSIANSLRNPRQFHYAYFGGRGCGGYRCETQKDGLPIYVLGDSHGTALFEGLKKNYPNQRFVLFIANACPIFTLNYTHNDAHTPQCLRAQAAALKEIGSGDAPVIITAHWAARMASSYIRNGVTKRFSTKDVKSFVEFVNSEIEQLRGKMGHRRVIVIGGVPRYQSSLSPLDCLTRPFRNDGCRTSDMKSSFIAMQESINEAFRKTRARNEFIDPYDYLCTNQKCRNTTPDGMPVYSDVTHLSTWGSDYLISAMKPTLSRMIFNGTASLSN